MILVLYVFGYGPVIYLSAKVPPAARKSLMMFYVPVSFLHGNPEMHRALTSYEMWWWHLADRP
jgi:hypothetical protein